MSVEKWLTMGKMRSWQERGSRAGKQGGGAEGGEARQWI
jgi:hypothetical protein